MRPGFSRVIGLSAALVLSLASPALAKPTGHESVPEAAPTWKLQFERPVVWQRVTSLGHLIVGTAAGLSGVDAVSGARRWHHADLTGVTEETLFELPGTPLVLAAERSASDRVVILDPADGRIVFDSAGAGVSKVLSAHVLPRSGLLVVVGFERDRLETLMMGFEISTGKKLWTNDDLVASGGKLVKALTALVQAATDDSGVRAEPFEIGEDAFVMVSGTTIYKFETATGKTLWRVSSPVGGGRSKLFMAPGREAVVYLGTEDESSGSSGTTYLYTYYTAVRVDDGSRVWDKPQRIRGPLNDVVFIDEGVLVSPGGGTKGAIKLLDYDTGRSLWGKNGKGIKGQGGIVDHVSTDAGLVITTAFDSAWDNAGIEYSLNILDTSAGALRFSSPLKVKGRMLYTEAVSKGVLYVTTSELNIFDPSTGKGVAKKSVASPDSLVTAARGNDLWAFSTRDGALYHVDKQSSSIERLSSGKIDLGNDRVPISLEVGDDRLTLVSSQNVVAFGLDGEELFHAHYPAPRHSGLVRALLIANGVRAGMASASTGVASGAFEQAAAQQPSGSLEEEISAGIARGYGEMSRGYEALSRSFFAEAGARFKASATSPDFVFMMVQFTKQDLGLARVSKKTGKILEMINMERDKTPSYQVDAIASRIYYRSTDNEIVSYSF